MRTKVKLWFHGLFGGAIGGGANAVVSALGVAGASALGYEVKALDLEQVGIVFVSGFIISMFLYLKQSPLPPPSSGDTQLIYNPNSQTITTNNDNETK